jgi:hypothetical protein
MPAKTKTLQERMAAQEAPVRFVAYQAAAGETGGGVVWVAPDLKVLPVNLGEHPKDVAEAAAKACEASFIQGFDPALDAAGVKLVLSAIARALKVPGSRPRAATGAEKYGFKTSGVWPRPTELAGHAKNVLILGERADGSIVNLGHHGYAKRLDEAANYVRRYDR